MGYQYEKHHEKMPGEGRPKGSITKNTELRNRIRDWSIEEFDEYVATWKKIQDPRDKCAEYRQMIAHVVPKITAMQFEMDDKCSSALQHLQMITRYKDESE